MEEKALGMEPSTNGVPRVEIDESEIIGNQNKILWMFGMIDRADKEARVFCIMNNRTKENLLPIIKENISYQPLHYLFPFEFIKFNQVYFYSKFNFNY